MRPFQTITLTVLGALGAVAGPVLAMPATPTATTPPAFAGHRLAGAAKITLSQARAIAVKARPGSITQQELEKERGGSGLRYSFDVTSSGVKYEVGVDAKTGQVLENGPEGKNPD